MLCFLYLISSVVQMALVHICSPKDAALVSRYKMFYSKKKRTYILQIFGSAWFPNNLRFDKISKILLYALENRHILKV